MHPEIEKFWENSFYKIVIDLLQDDLWKFYWVLIDSDGRQIAFAGVSDLQFPSTEKAKCITYFFNGKEYSESEMLRIVRLKAFL